MNFQGFKYALILLFAFTAYSASAQKEYKPKFKKSRNSTPDVFPSEQTFKPGGWLFGAGLTGMMSLRVHEHNIGDNGTPLTTQGGKLPFVTAEIGRYYNFKPFLTFSYFNYGLAYKGLLADEHFTVSGSDRNHRTLGHFASAYFDINSVISISSMHFIQNSLGVNVDYGIANESNDYPAGLTSESMTDLAAQLNYKLGFGFKADTDLMIIPYFQVNLFNFFPGQNRFNRLDVYNTSYVPVQLGVRVLLFNLDTDNCPDVDPNQLPAGFKNGYGDDW